MTVGLQSLGPRVVRRFSPKPEWHPTLEASDLLGCYAGLSPWNRYMYIYIYPNSLLLELSISFAKLNSPWMVKPPHLPMFRGKMSIFLGSNSVFLRCRFPEARAQRDEPRAKARLLYVPRCFSHRTLRTGARRSKSTHKIQETPRGS